MKIPNIKYKIITITMLMVMVKMYSLPVRAQQTLSLTAYPAVQEEEIKPGVKTRMQVKFKNNSEEPISGLIKVANYYVKDDQGSVELIDNINVKTKYAAGSWITTALDRVTIPGKDFVSVDLFVQPPDQIDSCGAYAIVYLQPEPNALIGGTSLRESASSVTTKVGTLLNFSVAGQKCRETATISKLEAPNFLEYGPIKITYEIANNGNIHITPKGVIILSNSFGQSTDQIKLDEKRIFPETNKKYENELGAKWMIGKYKINLSAGYGNTNQLINKIVYVWVFPWRIALAIILAIIILVLIIKNIIEKTVVKEAALEKEIEKEKSEIEKLKEQLKKRE